MPIYEYQCRACDLSEERLAGIDNREVVCTECGEVMDRLVDDEEAMAQYFDKPRIKTAT